MIKCAIIGGGIAGLTSAVYLSRSGFKVKLYEASPKLGGRAYSFLDKPSGNVIDNGQHIMMGCYFNTLKLLQTIGSTDQIYFQKKLNIPFVDKEYGIVPLKAYTTLYPINLLLGLLKYNALSFTERLKIIKTILKILTISPQKVEKLSVTEWLHNEDQNERAIKAFWEILSVSALNAKMEDASALLFVNILKEIFFNGNKAASIIIPKFGLSELISEKASSYIKNNNGEVFLSKQVESITIENNTSTGLKFADGNIENFDYIISAIPLYSLLKIINRKYLKIENDYFEYSPIISVHLWLKENSFSDKFYGLIDSPIHWVFNHKDFITIVISSADNLIDLEKDEIINLTIEEIEKYFPHFSIKHVKQAKVIKEKRATFIPTVQSEKKRNECKINIKNFYVAGDWTNTGLPATIEGAVKSGQNVFDKIIQVNG